ncbi:hypothetical protein QYM36_019931 [Artemia franciscana]|uniref:Uncharacterized protein n=1 Tax=Artemia franciscana TaxID=6661 RepID=A0AA88KSR7_ARTSF|nr:hypothetical protein QYM36_019931 [Artemia franciscana]
MDIFRANSAVLLSVDYPEISWKKSSDNTKAVGIELEVRVGRNLKQQRVLFYNRDSQRVPQSRDIPKLPSSVRLDFFNVVLKIDEFSDIVDLFPNNVKVFICSVIFWLKTKENQVSKPTEQQFQSLVIMSLMDEKIPCKVPKSESSSNGSICQLCNEVCTKDCLVAKIKLRELFQGELKDKYTKDKNYDKDTVHTHWQRVKRHLSMGDTFNCQSIYIYYTLPPGDNGGFGSTDPLQIQQPDVSKTTGRRKRKSALPNPQPPPSTPTTSTPRTYKKKKRALLTETALTGRELRKRLQ